eukprot:gb/GFBE01060010.1/.p1 GENE.gb/GFBE01060010.1/~~gb/GFBE01060010.1/.p1  ORF type:complete len:483 (+),score=84.05 gb/GFBE01060010.1/:1-1449(+)
MQGCASNFTKVLEDFKQKLHGAEFVAIDTELTGVDIEGEQDSFDDSAVQRLDRQCRIAERYAIIQLGLTVVGRKENGGREDHLTFSSYNLFAFPYDEPEFIGRGRGFFCQASALQFNAQHKVDFNTWIREGIPYMSREDERRMQEMSGTNVDDRKTGLLRLWKALCSARVPFVVHNPNDLFFLLSAFERRLLPRQDPKSLAVMIRQCTSKVYDTAHLHGALGRFKRLKLMQFFKDAKALYDDVSSNGNGIQHVKFELLGDTKVRYSGQNNDLTEELAHEAGFDSLVTAQLFAYLRVISPAQVNQAANRLFLYKSIEYLDLERIVLKGEVGVCMFDLSRVTLLVAELEPADGNEAPRLIQNAGYVCKWVDPTHVLVVLRASGGAAVRKAADLAGQVHGVVSWMGFDEWREAESAKVAEGRSARAAQANFKPEDLYPDAEDCIEESDSAGETLGQAWQRLARPASVGLATAGVALLLLKRWPRR